MDRGSKAFGPEDSGFNSHTPDLEAIMTDQIEAETYDLSDEWEYIVTAQVKLNLARDSYEKLGGPGDEKSSLRYIRKELLCVYDIMRHIDDYDAQPFMDAYDAIGNYFDISSTGYDGDVHENNAKRLMHHSIQRAMNHNPATCMY